MKERILKGLAGIAGIMMLFAAGCSSDSGSSGPKVIPATGVVVQDGTGATSGNLYIGDTSTVTLTAVVAPENATVQIVEWTVSNSNAVTIVSSTDSTCVIKAGTEVASDVVVMAKVTGSNVTGSYSVNVAAKLTGITPSVAETVKKEYGFKESFDSTGVTVTATYSDGTTSDVTDNVVYSFGSDKVSALNTYTSAESIAVNVSYTENGITKNSDSIYTVSVNTGDWELGNITISTTGAKTEYSVGDELDKSGVTASGNMVNKTTSAIDEEVINLTSLLAFSGFDSSASYLGTEDSHELTKTQTITVKYNDDNTTTYDVTIKAIPVTTVKLSSNTLTLYKNKEKTVTLTVLPVNATFKKVNWTVTGNDAGLVTVTDVEGGKKIAAGETVTESPVTITATLADNAEKTASCAVTVKEQPKVTAWNFASWSTETKTNVAADAEWVQNTDGTSRYKKNVDGEAVANGVVIKELEGITFDKTASVTISWDSSKGVCLQTASTMEIPVEGGYPVTFVFSNTGKSNGTRTLKVVENETETEVGTSATSDNVTKTYTPAAATTSIIIKCYDKDGVENKGAFNFYSIKGPSHATALNLAIDGSSSVSLKEGVAKDITATVTPADAVENTVTWTSDKPAIVKVEDGKITPLAVSSETVTITGTLANGVSGTFTVNGVIETIKPTSIAVKYANASTLDKLVVGYSKTLAVTYEPENVEAKALTWESSNPTAVSVEDGVIKGLTKSESAVTITAKTVNGKTATFVINSVVDPADITDALVITKEGGWFRSVYAEWIPSADTTVNGYNAYVIKDSTATKLDKELIRKYADHYRVDALGLAAGDYQLKIVAVRDTEETEIFGTSGTVKAVADDRTGFAFKGGAEPGAYKADGTLKEGTTVVYVTEANKNTVKATIKGTTYTGIAEITQAVKTKNNAQPFDFRVIGMLTMDGLVCADLSSAYAMGVKTAENVTIEGVGEDATFNGVGLAAFEESNNIEFCNIALYDWKDDGISLKKTTHAWMHNCDIFYGHPGSAADQKKGDGSMDLKDDSKYVTISYMHFWDSGKMSLCGMKSETGSNWIDYHHNWFDHSDSRHPRIRTMSVHVWNNYYDGNSKYGVGTAKDSEAFVENNYFRGTKYPMMSSQQGTDALGDGTFSGENGGVIKSYNNYMTGEKSYITYQQNSESFDAYEATSRNETVPSTVTAKVGGKVYSNFDTNSTYMHGPYTPDATMDVPNIVMGKVAGRVGAGRMNGGDLKWTFTTADDESYDINTELKAYVFAYTSPVKETYATATSAYTLSGTYNGGTPSGSDDEPAADPVAVTGVTLDKTTAELVAGGKVTLKATVAPADATVTTVTWTTSDSKVATVSKGTVTAVAAGTATITATTTDGSFTATCTVTVTNPTVSLPTTAVAAGTVNLATGGKVFSSQNAGDSQTKENILLTTKIDSKGAYVYGTKAGAGDSSKGGVYFKLDSQMTVTLACAADNGINIYKVDSDGTLATSSETTTHDTTNLKYTATLSAGTYVVLGAATSSTKISSITFAAN